MSSYSYGIGVGASGDLEIGWGSNRFQSFLKPSTPKAEPSVKKESTSPRGPQPTEDKVTISPQARRTQDRLRLNKKVRALIMD